MSKKVQEKVTLKGVEIPQWYLDLEPKLLEQMEAIEKMESKLKALRTTIYNMMEDDGIDCIKSELATVTKTKDSVVEQIAKDKLKEEMPKIYAKYMKMSTRKGSLTVKLTDAKQ